jgi:glycosyltransferase involved in cell wall biosynthesis
LTEQVNRSRASTPVSRRPAASVTICIPAYQAEAFIERTLRFAAGQTLRDVRILVSVDRSTDRTEEICRAFAATDDRVTVMATTSERLGWGGNTNRLIDAVETEFFFLYFHDDIILPQYCEALVSALRDQPEAVSANCSVQAFGTTERVTPAAEYPGDVTDRLVRLWLPPTRGAPLRSMIRRARIGADVRVPAGVGDAFLARLLARGPALAVRKPLYLRWLRREGLTGRWRPFEDHLTGWRKAITVVFEVLAVTAFESDRHRELVRHVLLLFVWGQILDRFESGALERPSGATGIEPPAWRSILGRFRRTGTRLPGLDELHPQVGGLEWPAGVSHLVPDHLERIRERHEQVRARHARLARQGRR